MKQPLHDSTSGHIHFIISLTIITWGNHRIHPTLVRTWNATWRNAISTYFLPSHAVHRQYPPCHSFSLTWVWRWRAMLWPHFQKPLISNIFFFELKWWVDTPQHFIHKQLLRLPKGIYMLKDWFSQLLTPVPNMCIMDGIPNFLHIINQVF